jgi:ADP-ribose pyrophosphatase
MESDIVYDGRLFKVARRNVVLPNGEKTTRDIVVHPGAAAIVPVMGDGSIVMIKQFRLAAEKHIWEIPAGTLEEGEPPETCAFRELREETGYRAGKMRKLTSIYPSPGYVNEIIHIYVATNLWKEMAQMMDDEDITTELVPPDKIRKMIYAGEITDAKTIVGLMMFWNQQ